MRFTIHDVGHGFCAHLKHDNGNVMLWDCGHKADPEYRPSRFLPAAGISTVHRMFITNYDEDHISDLPNLRQAVHINVLHRNPSITPAQIRRLKEEGGPISPAMSSLLSMLNTYNQDVSNPPCDLRYTKCPIGSYIPTCPDALDCRFYLLTRRFQYLVFFVTTHEIRKLRRQTEISKPLQRILNLRLTITHELITDLIRYVKRNGPCSCDTNTLFSASRSSLVK